MEPSSEGEDVDDEEDTVDLDSRWVAQEFGCVRITTQFKWQTQGSRHRHRRQSRLLVARCDPAGAFAAASPTGTAILASLPHPSDLGGGETVGGVTEHSCDRLD